MNKELACRNCRTLTNGKICPNCHSSDLATTWSGVVFVLDAKHSEISRTLGFDKPGRYAVKVI